MANTTTKAQPVRNVQALVTAAGAVVAALSATAVLSDNEVVGWITVGWGILMAGYTAYQGAVLPGKVVPLEDAASYLNEDGDEVAGPASPLPGGTATTTEEATAA